MAYYANIIIDISHEKIDKTFQYRIPQEMLSRIMPGCVVQVPFGQGNTLRKGFVLEVTDQCEYDASKLKDIAGVDEAAVEVETQLIALAAWMKRRYGGTMNQALNAVLSIKKKTKRKEQRTIRLALSEEDANRMLQNYQRKHNVARERLLAALMEEKSLDYDHAVKELKITAALVKTLEEQGIITIEHETAYRNPVQQCNFEHRQVFLNEEQRQVCDTVILDLKQGISKTYLLHGVTGSGKTQVYMELIDEVLKQGRQAIVLIPEIALTYQTVTRFYARFGDLVSIINSRLSIGERYDQFTRAKKGEVRVMIGPRSALFTPFENLGLIIIDEEHESSYKSESVPRYHARDVAMERARMSHASVVLGSATPSIDSYYLAKQGIYQLLELRHRVENKPLPICHTVDLREELRSGNRSILSRRLQELMEDRLSKGQQTMLFLNRRGMLGFVSCRSCGEVIKCPHCDVSLSFHKNNKLLCHYCGYEIEAPKQCPNCQSKYISGFKAGTQKIEEIVKVRFPKARILRMDYDTTRKKESYQDILTAFSRGEADVLIGTQMIVKGHDFPNVTLVGILAADMSMNVGDYTAAERTFQLITQAAGRAGRGRCTGEVVLQTYNTTHYCIETAQRQDYEAFYEQELSYRRMCGYPPVAQMLAMIISSPSEEYAKAVAKRLSNVVSNSKIEGLRMIGPADALIAKVNDIYRQVIYFKHQEEEALIELKDRLERFIAEKLQIKQVMISFDFNPIHGI